MSITLHRKLALLTDEEATKCLNGLLHSLSIEKEEFGRLLQTPEDMNTVIQEAAENKISPAQLENISEEGSKAIRVLLVELGDTEEFGGPMEVWIDGARETMLVPLAVPLVLAGIVLVLSTDIKIEYQNEDGKKRLHFKLEKSATTEKILGKFFGLFAG